MIIHLEKNHKKWQHDFKHLHDELKELLPTLNPVIEHIGSTSIPDLLAKPIIDIQLGVKSESDFPMLIDIITQHPQYLYYKVFNESMPRRRLFVKINVDRSDAGLPKTFSSLEAIPHELVHKLRVAHIHCWQLDTEDWIRHLAFRDYLKKHPQVKNAYAKLKQQLVRREWKDGMSYNKAKEEFILRVQEEAIAWYKRT